VKCGGKNCTQHVHPLCARNSGGYLTTRDVGGRIVHRTFCQVARRFSSPTCAAGPAAHHWNNLNASCHTMCWSEAPSASLAPADTILFQEMPSS
jgi:hypothetical protein